MDTKNGLNRHTEFALLSALAAGLVSFIMIATFMEILDWIFIPSVMIMVFISAYFAFRRQMRGKGALTGGNIFWIAFEVGTVTHFYTFALYLPAYYFLYDFQGINGETFGIYLMYTLIGGLASLVMFVWIAVPMYIGVGYLVKANNSKLPADALGMHESVLDQLD